MVVVARVATEVMRVTVMAMMIGWWWYWSVVTLVVRGAVAARMTIVVFLSMNRFGKKII